MKYLDLPSPAKLNLFLHITGRRADGYHELQTLFRLLDFGDRVSVEARTDGAIELDCTGLDLPPEENLAWRAARLLREQFPREAGEKAGADIRILKQIPAGGGLGGGSSNAATVLLALNRLWGLDLPLERLAELALELGADVPVFVGGRSAWAEGVGERLQPVSLPDRYYLVLAPDCAVSTGAVFADPDLTRNTSPITMADFCDGGRDPGARNDCEAVVRRLYPRVDEALEWLGRLGPARLSGTGACVFLECGTREEGEALLSGEARRTNRRGFVARGVEHSPVHRLLGYQLPGYQLPDNGLPDNGWPNQV